jgi:uncharacterized coiled-coil DUF342 family protein
MELLEAMVDRTHRDYMDSADDYTDDIRDLQTQVKELHDEMKQVKQRLDTMGYEWRHRN